MKNTLKKNTTLGLVGLGALALLAGCNNSNKASTEGSTPAPQTAGGKPALTIAVIPKGTTHEYWQSVDAGATQAGKDLGVTIAWKGPLQESDRAAQIAIVQQFVSSGVSGIVLAPLDDTALASPVASAKAKNIPVVVIDSPLKGTPGTDYVSLVATDNHKGGVLAGQKLSELLGGKGKVVLLRYAEGSSSTMAREAGFLEAIKKSPGIQIIEQSRYAGATQGEAQTNAMQMIDTLRRADGIFCPNESSTLGMLQALKQNQLAGKVKFVGFDASPPEVSALQGGQISALVAQNPVKMGYTGVQTVVAKIRGQAPPVNVDTGVTVIDSANLQSPDVQKLLAGK